MTPAPVPGMTPVFNAALSRRDFLATTSVAATALAAVPVTAWPAEPSTNQRVRVGIDGGGFGRSFQLHEHPDYTAEAVSDFRPERRDGLMKTYGCAKSNESLEKLILDRCIDAVALFTPAPDLVRPSVAALRAGKHVLCAVACTAPGIVAHQPALRAGERMEIPSFDAS